MYTHYTGWWFPMIYPTLTWQRQIAEKVIYLTFDDGPIPEVTEFVFETLADFSAKATFFCIGDNVRKYPHIFKKIIEQKHSIGNHTFNHLNGWNTPLEDYVKNTLECEKIINHYYQDIGIKKRLFRPPYGRISFEQIDLLSPDYEIIMWTVLSADFDRDLAKETCLAKTIKYTAEGSIIVFHDSLKAEPNLVYTLPRFLEYFTKQGFRFDKLN